MRIISTNNIQAQALARPTEMRKGAREKDVNRSSDSYEASGSAKEMNMARRAAMASNGDVRADRVAELKARIQSGQYDVSAWDIASSLVDARV
ncbi:MAG: flagellar biosynthesis anti-sigma factor FlgM [Defluviitaleaceae bacterium]|nr:flagellar biosynthesis anti-sigma factor FlgM [Defluviitaleaceae bacterium]